MSFLANLSTYGTVETTRSYSYSKHLDPKERLRVNFIENARRQIVYVKSDAVLPTNAWVSKRTLAGGQVQYKVSLRVGPRLIQLSEGATHIVMDSKEKVIEFLDAALNACKKGELDDLLHATSGKARDGRATAIVESPVSTS